MKGQLCDPYLDDVLCYADDFEDGVKGLKKVLQRLRSKGVKLRADKCAFMKREVRYLGRLVSGDGFRVDPKDTDALERFREPPKTVGELRSLLGLFGYYRCYVKNFARHRHPHKPQCISPFNSYKHMCLYQVQAHVFIFGVIGYQWKIEVKLCDVTDLGILHHPCDVHSIRQKG